MGYEARINSRRVQGGGAASLLEAMSRELERKVAKAVATVYCEEHGEPATIAFSRDGRLRWSHQHDRNDNLHNRRRLRGSARTLDDGLVGGQQAANLRATASAVAGYPADA